MKEIVRSYNVEFGYEIILILPYAYWLYNNNKLDYTISNRDMKPFYFFDDKHVETNIRRYYNLAYSISNIPNKQVHGDLDFSKWMMPDFKSVYLYKPIIIDNKDNKPLMIVSNKYNVEWGMPPVNYINSETLRYIFNHLKNDYKIVYNRMVDVNYSDINLIDLGEFDMIKNEFPYVTTIQDLVLINNGLTYNELQLRLYSKCENFISIQGGLSILASLFGGKNLIFAVKGGELKSGIVGGYNGNDTYNKWYHKLGNSKIYLSGSSHCMDVIEQKHWDDLIVKTKKIF